MNNTPRFVLINPPRLQLIRGLPGVGKSTAAKRYDCLHLELDQYCIRGGAYRWGEQRDYMARGWLGGIARYVMDRGIDLVVSGVMPCVEFPIDQILAHAHYAGYVVYIADLESSFNNRHGVREKDMERFRRRFVPAKSLVAESPVLANLESDGRLVFGFMPEKLELLPEADGL